MSRYAIDPPDEDRYEPKPLDAADEQQDGEPWPTNDPIDPPIDPAEHAAYALIDALSTLSHELITATEFPRVMDLWKMARDIEVRAATVVNLAAKRADEIIERRR